MKLINIILIIILCMLYGLFFAMGKFVLSYTEPFFFTGVRMLVAGIVLHLFMLVYDPKACKLNKSEYIVIFWISLFAIYLTNGLEFWGLQYLTAGKACFIYSLSPIITAIISYFYFKEYLTLRQIFGLAVSILGFVPILLESAPQEDMSGRIRFLSYAEISLMGAAIATSAGWVMIGEGVRNLKINPVVINSTSMILGGFMALIHSFITESWEPLPISDYQQFIFWMVLIILNSNIIAYNLHAYLTNKFTVTFLDLATLSSVFFAAMFGYLFFSESMSWVFWLSFSCVLFGIYIYFHESSVPVQNQN